MQKNTKIIVISLAVLAIIGSVTAIVISRKPKKDKKRGKKDLPPKDQTTQEDTVDSYAEIIDTSEYVGEYSGGGDPDPSPTKTSGSWARYVVATQTTSLNIRKSPTTSSQSIGSLPKGSTIFARPSSTSGWHEYSSNGSTLSGYVSSDYIKKA